MKPFSLSIRRQQTPEPNKAAEILPSLKRQASSELPENMPPSKTPKTPADSFRPISVSPTMASPLSKANISPIPPMEGFTISPHSMVTYRSRVYFSPDTVRKIVKQASPIGVETKREIAIYQYLQGREGTDKYLAPYKASTNSSIVNTTNSIFLNMEKLEGLDMIDYLRSDSTIMRPERLQERKDLVIKISTALRWFAEQGFLHRDIKFDNLFREENGNIRLIDIGMAVSLDSELELPYGNKRFIKAATFGQVRNEISVFIDKIVYGLLFEDNNEISEKLVTILKKEPNPDNLKKSIIDFYTEVIAELQGSQAGGRRYRRRSQKVHRRIRKTHRKNRRHQ